MTKSWFYVIIKEDYNIIDTVVKLNKTETLYLDLKALAIRLEPGDRFLSSREIMSRFNVSQVTVTQAMERLIRDGLVIKSQGKATRVTEHVNAYKPDAKPVFCLVLPHWNSPWLGLLEDTFLALSRELGYELVIHIYKKELHVSEFPKSRIDAFFVLPYQFPVETILELKKLSVPVLFIGTHEYSEFSCIGADHEYIGMLAASYLIDLGHRKIGYVCIHEKQDISLTQIKCQRSFRNTCELRNAEFIPIDVIVAEDELDYRKVYEKFKELFASGQVNFSAVFTMCAPQALRAILESGYRVPEDISLLTIGEDPMFEFMYPSITSVSGNPEAIVRKAVEQAFSELHDSASKHWIIVKHTVIERESTAKYKKGEPL